MNTYILGKRIFSGVQEFKERKLKVCHLEPLHALKKAEYVYMGDNDANDYVCLSKSKFFVVSIASFFFHNLLALTSIFLNQWEPYNMIAHLMVA